MVRTRQKSNPTDSDKTLFTFEHAHRLTGLATATLKRMAAGGKLEVVQCNARKMVLRRELIRLGAELD
jgi:hypothetical protein